MKASTQVVAVGASAGGVEALSVLVADLPADLDAADDRVLDGQLFGHGPEKI